jgi:hypothetical protein
MFWWLLLSCELTPLALGGPSAGDQLSQLRDTAMFHESIVARGEAISAIAQHKSPDADRVLADIQSFGNAPELVRTWAAAGRIQRTDSLEKLAELAPQMTGFPAVARPMRLKVAQLPGGSASDLLTLAVQVPELQSAITPLLTASDPAEIASAMLTHENTEARRLAAGLIGGMAQGTPDLPSQVAAVYAFVPSAAAVPWKGGALYVPGLGWNRDEARAIMGSLIEWHLFCDLGGLAQEQQQIYNNLRSVGLWRQAGMRNFPNNNTLALLQQWRQVVGGAEMAEMLDRQGVRYDPKYAGALER